MKKAKSILTMAALAMGLGIGFGAAFTPAQAKELAAAQCTKNSDCRSVCSPSTQYVCSGGTCFCGF